MLCLCPALWGIYIHLKQAREIKHRDARALMTMTSSALDNYVGILWVSTSSRFVSYAGQPMFLFKC